jgi:ubiquinone/menaquinone biosynthesis C-methylase UbiE
MLQEFKRVTKPGGTIFISTPNFPVNSPSGKVTNPYHTQEFTFEELKKVLDLVFANTIILGQRYSRYDKGQTNKIGKVVAWFFGIKGIRKLPYALKNFFSTLFTGKPFYPDSSDFTMEKDENAILKCKTFFCICRK